MADIRDEAYKVGETIRGHQIYRRWNRDVGGWDYISDALGRGYIPVLSCVSADELEIILKDMKFPSQQSIDLAAECSHLDKPEPKE